MLQLNFFVFLISLFFSASFAVLIGDPKKFPCEDYDLFDPPERILRESNGFNPNRPETHEELALQIVQQLNARSNSLFQSLLVQVKHANVSEDGKVKVSFYQVETRCRNNKKTASGTSLIGCPYREQGKVQECSVTVPDREKPSPVNMEKINCKPARFSDVLRVETNGGIGDLISSDSMIWYTSPLVGYRAPTPDNFRCFMLRYKKSYSTTQERQQRFQNFQMNMKRAFLYQITEQGTGVYGPTQHSDLSVEEFRQKYTGLKPELKEFTNMKKAVIPDNINDLPDSFDWRNKSAVTPVKDQGTCGSCWAFSTTGNIEGLWAIKKGLLVSLSEQELVDCDKLDSGCGGGLPSNAYKAIIELGGLETEGDYPYDGRDDKCSFKKSDVKVYINDSVEISQDETEMAQWLVKNGPISIGINANAMMLYFGGISHPWKVLCSSKNLDHGVLIVGYGIQGKNPYWIVKNSWGPHWGEKGYYLVYRGDGTCGLNQMCTSAVIA